jgi:hypothetical protein
VHLQASRAGKINLFLDTYRRTTELNIAEMRLPASLLMDSSQAAPTTSLSPHGKEFSVRKQFEFEYVSDIPPQPSGKCPIAGNEIAQQEEQFVHV